MSTFPSIDLKIIREKSGFDQLDTRQRLLLLGATVFLLVFLVFQFMITPYYSSRARLLNSVQQKAG